jgi:hypothetical protein
MLYKTIVYKTLYENIEGEPIIRGNLPLFSVELNTSTAQEIELLYLLVDKRSHYLDKLSKNFPDGYYTFAFFQEATFSRMRNKEGQRTFKFKGYFLVHKTKDHYHFVNHYLQVGQLNAFNIKEGRDIEAEVRRKPWKNVPGSLELPWDKAINEDIDPMSGTEKKFSYEGSVV